MRSGRWDNEDAEHDHSTQRKLYYVEARVLIDVEGSGQFTASIARSCPIDWML